MKKLFIYLSLLLMPLLTLTYASAQNNKITLAAMEAEKSLNARLGLSVLDLETQQHWQYHADQRFPLNSTFKTLACANVLHRVDSGSETLNRAFSFTESKLVDYSPVTKAYAGHKAMTLAELCHATMTMSDNTAANLILEALGGPSAVTEFSRTLGDHTTRLDRWETTLNEAIPGDLRDTTTPDAMLNNLNVLLFSNLLSPASRSQLRRWMEHNRVADRLFRSVLPPGWSIADRTGAGGHGSRSITAVFFPPGRKPVIAAVYITDTQSTFAARNRAIAEIGAAIASTINNSDAK